MVKNHHNMFFVVAFLVLLYFFIDSNKEKESNARPFAFRMIEDELYGSVYEMAIIYSGDLETLIEPTSDYIELIYQGWCNNTNIPTEITTMKVSFYDTEEKATEWTVPNESTYLFR